MTDTEKKAYIERARRVRQATSCPRCFAAGRVLRQRCSRPPMACCYQAIGERQSTRNAYDVIDRTGARRAQLLLRPNEHILGFGATSVYVIETDRDGIQRLRRHRTTRRPIRP